MLDTLKVTHEGTNDVRRTRKHTLIQEYEMFRMLKGESVDQEWSSSLKNPNPLCLMQGCVAVVFWEGFG